MNVKIIVLKERQRLNADQLTELECRREVSIIIRNLVIVFRASKCASPAASWFASKVLWAYKRAKKLQVRFFVNCFG
jgi:hypothetical protein